MLIAQSTIKSLHSYFPHTCWVRQVLTLAINNVAQKEKATLKSCEDVAGSRRTQSPFECLWSLVSSFPGLSVKLWQSFSFFTWYCFCIHLYVNICMKLDPNQKMERRHGEIEWNLKPTGNWPFDFLALILIPVIGNEIIKLLKQDVWENY
jgi:hypothetical protein